MMVSGPSSKKKKPDMSVVWREAKEIIWAYRAKVALGMVVMVIGRLAALVAPASSKFLIDDVIGDQPVDRNEFIARDETRRLCGGARNDFENGG